MTENSPADLKKDALLEAERLRRQKGRNWAVFAVLASTAILIFLVTIVKIKLGYRP